MSYDNEKSRDKNTLFVKVSFVFFLVVCLLVLKNYFWSKAYALDVVLSSTSFFVGLYHLLVIFALNESKLSYNKQLNLLFGMLYLCLTVITLLLSDRLGDVKSLKIDMETWGAISAAVGALVIAVATAYYLVAIQGTFNQANRLLDTIKENEVNIKSGFDKISNDFDRISHVNFFDFNSFSYILIKELSLVVGNIASKQQDESSTKLIQDINERLNYINAFLLVISEFRKTPKKYSRDAMSNLEALKKSLSIYKNNCDEFFVVPYSVLLEVLECMNDVNIQDVSDENYNRFELVRSWVKDEIQKRKTNDLLP